MFLNFCSESDGFKAISDLSDLSDQDDKTPKTIFGTFTTHILLRFKKSGSPSLQTAMNYLSCLKGIFIRICETDIFNDLHWYQVKVRRNTTSKYVAYAQKEGITLQNTADDITDEILRLLCEQMVDSNSWIGIENRALLIVLWHLLG
ncbi:uncharacterized protein PHALS_08194 [Plasmopara halstedii]|uniref:Uncharacterized protein n=1 Tax=Plasmopara halstedii TaxID=4781 RepID=A0A0P1ACY0_PLAHL|nr:uncharacterized protein PHALS_08194 [Plasmopara halstedii]CEG38100.1 hypothetical protein PHALS_08194 [Plasmopara halstedii]|eukprot:XP_024574469.1 hypothetical protein PHALS_08194 [Plasmopara halstedii]